MKKYKILVTILSALGIFTIMLTACHKNEHNKTVSEKYSANVKSNSSSEKSHEITSSVKQNASTVATSNYDKQSAKSVTKDTTSINNQQQTNQINSKQVSAYSQTNNDNQKVNLTNATMAENYLKQKLNLTSNNIYAGNNEQFNGSDSLGNFYTIELVDMSQRLSGKTGLIGYYKVYQNGLIKSQN
ncbi:MAG: hypothetical protein H9901_03050 [Candidatus Paralactobacillus gallistercoris]|uniref:Lipoprotein n=1 Tax=Candidatus Paralactobacillus gallistercoris TaxID=2838724 RepID=A0A948X0T5_9LACO|nr:hypothetical protein [Candidatus Paralactobacillus gallistercoris]